MRSLECLQASAKIHRTSFDEGEIVWREWGAGPPLVLIHGGFGSWRHWVRNIPGLSSHFRILAPDLPGMGDSDPVPETDTPSEIVAALTSGLAQVLGDHRQYHVAGFSFGGMIAGVLAATEGERVRSLALMASIGLATGRPRPAVTGFRRLAGEERRAAHRSNLMSMMFADPIYADDLALEIQEINNLSLRATSFGLTLRPFLREALSAIEPVPHLIWGECDNLGATYMHENIAIVRATRPDAKVEIQPGAGHWILYEMPERINTFILNAAFLDN